MRVLFCALEYPPSPTGGAERQAQLQAEELQRRGHVVEVVCQRTAGTRSGPVNGVRVHRLPRIDRRFFRTLSYLAALGVFLVSRLRRFDLVHVHLANAQADVAVAAARLVGRGSYLKVAAGGPLGEIGRFHRVALVTRYYGIRNADVVQAISGQIAEDLKAVGVRPERIRRIPNGVRIPDVGDSDRDSARAALGVGAEELVVLYTGRLERDKGVADLLDAWRDVQLSGSRMLLIGSRGVKDPVPMTDLPAGAEYRGWTADVRSYLVAADVFVLPSHVEGMSNALLEAMAMGLPCVATTVGGAVEMIRHGESGLLVQPGDTAAITHALRLLAADAGRRTSIGQAGRAFVAGRYGIESVVERIVDAYAPIGVSR